MKRVGFGLLIILIASTVYGQKNEDWYNKDYETDGQVGASGAKVRENFDGREPQEVIVAVIDSGVDIDHEDLKENIWVNKYEIAGNGIDDDKNGYVDDIHGWNFLGGKEGNVTIALYETTRIYRKLKPKFENKKASDIKPEEKEDYELYLETKKETEKQLKKTNKELEEFRGFQQNIRLVNSILETKLLDKPITKENVEAMEADTERLQAARSFMLQLYENGFVQKDFDRYMDDLKNRSLYHYNLDFNPREIVGDNPEDPFEKFYGNNDVEGDRADHGTHVSGIIGAVRGNGLGINGVAHNIKIMVLRAVPDGDERDKDIANAIIYAVDNGARIINMSFGKGHSPAKEAVDRAVRYAEERDVLLIHAAGNASLNIDVTHQYPEKYYTTGGMRGAAENWINVGASGREKGKDLPASFSNYGRKNVDIFAPGVRIYSTVPDNEYSEQDGTSMAAPVVSGVAALVLNYFPDLTAVQLREVLLKSATSYGKVKVKTPSESGKGKNTKFKKLSVTGRVVNAYNALNYARKKYGKSS